MCKARSKSIWTESESHRGNSGTRMLRRREVSHDRVYDRNWIGLLAGHPDFHQSVSPGHEIAAISYIGRKVGHSRQVFLTGLLYTVGRTLAYLALAIVLLASVLSVPQISLFLQK